MKPVARLGGAALAAIVVVAGSACSTAPTGPNSTMGRIQDELRQTARNDAARAAPRPDAVERALLPPLQIESPRPSAGNEPRFDLAVSNAPAAQVFMSIVGGSRYSILVPPEVTGAVSANLKNVTVKEALDALRDLYGYEYRIQGTRDHDPAEHGADADLPGQLPRRQAPGIDRHAGHVGVDHQRQRQRRQRRREQPDHDPAGRRPDQRSARRAAASRPRATTTSGASCATP